MRKPPAGVFVASGVAFQGMVYSALALGASRGDRRRGWRRGRPGPLNRFGIAAVAGGLAFIGWAALGHHRAMNDDLQLTPSPDYLAQGGAYAVSRNPLYVGGMTVWFGWSAYRGSGRAAVAGVLWLTMLSTVGIPFEERKLERAFGDAYLAYRRRVPRWL